MNDKNGFFSLYNRDTGNQSIKMDDQCSALTNDRKRCSNRPKQHGLCGIHVKCRNKAGPNQFERDQLDIKHKNEVARLRENIIGDTNRADVVNFDARMAQFQHQYRAMYDRHTHEKRELRERQQRLIIETGVNPDAGVEARRVAEREAARQEREARQLAVRIAQERRRADAERENADLHRRLVAAFQNGAGDVVEALRAWQDLAPAPPPPERRLADIAADRQNVHTREIVQQTKDIVAKVRTIPVPEAYRWNKDFVSPTIGEIIAACKLTSHAAAQMFNKYVSHETIYEMEEGIYGKVLDSVWQFVKNSPDKDDLCRIIKQELEDNVGMCAQGNLSRICNILAGYMDGIGPQESVAEKLGRLFPALMDIEDDAERRRRGEQILMENRVPGDQWANWLEAL